MTLSGSLSARFAQHFSLHKPVEPVAIEHWWYAGDQTSRPPFERPLKEGLTFLVKVPLLQVVNYRHMVDVLAAH